MTDNPVFCALDTQNPMRASQLAENLSPHIGGIKIGMEFFYAAGLAGYQSLAATGLPIFLDLKLNDIPNTVVSAVKSLKNLKISYLTVHLSSGLSALKALKKVSRKIKIVGVTTLTSLNNKDLKEVGYNKKVNELVRHQAKLASKAKLDAIVCSGHEIRSVKRVFKKEIITPGIKMHNTKNDQKRVMRPTDAFAEGSNWLVIGRSITNGNIKKNIRNLLEILED